MRLFLLKTAADLYTIWNWILTGRWTPDMSDTADTPTNVYLTDQDEIVVCLLEQIGPNRWQATPVRDLIPNENLRLHVDRLPPGGIIEIVFPTTT